LLRPYHIRRFPFRHLHASRSSMRPYRQADNCSGNEVNSFHSRTKHTPKAKGNRGIPLRTIRRLCSVAAQAITPNPRRAIWRGTIPIGRSILSARHQRIFAGTGPGGDTGSKDHRMQHAHRHQVPQAPLRKCAPGNRRWMGRRAHGVEVSSDSQENAPGSKWNQSRRLSHGPVKMGFFRNGITLLPSNRLTAAVRIHP
jgi:hypothetical protein